MLQKRKFILEYFLRNLSISLHKIFFFEKCIFNFLKKILKKNLISVEGVEVIPWYLQNSKKPRGSLGSPSKGPK